jgi:hypothetical protein
MRNTSADSILSLARLPLDNMHPLPVVSYAVSLAMSVVYRELRSNTVHSEQVKAAKRLQEACIILEKLEPFFSTSRFMIKIAKQLLETIRKANKSVPTEDPASNEIANGETIQKILEQQNLSTTMDQGSLVFNDDQMDTLSPLFQFDADLSWDMFDSAFGTNMNPSLPTNFDSFEDFYI